MQIRVYSYNTLDKVHSFDAHSDYVRGIAIHPTQPLILNSSDDMLIKLWNWEKMWAGQRIFEGHTHYGMQILFNLKDNNTFSSASLDRTGNLGQMYQISLWVKCTKFHFGRSRKRCKLC